jgi:hypothetical protein
MELAQLAHPVTASSTALRSRTEHGAAAADGARTRRPHSSRAQFKELADCPEKIKITDNALIPAEAAHGGLQAPFAGPDPRVVTARRARTLRAKG